MMAADHLKLARASAEFVDQNINIAALVKPVAQRAIMHALIDIAESLRALAHPALRVSYAGLSDLPLEADDGTDDEEDKGDNE